MRLTPPNPSAKDGFAACASTASQLVGIGESLPPPASVLGPRSDQTNPRSERRCRAYHCTEALSKVTHEFCSAHEGLALYCRVAGCDNPVVPGRKSCTEPEHAAAESRYSTGHERGFLHRVARQGGANPARGGAARAPDISALANYEEFDEDFDTLRDVDEDTEARVGGAIHGDATCARDLARSRFGRARVHNMMIATASCGIVLSSWSMYTAESLPAVAVRYSSKTRTHADSG